MSGFVPCQAGHPHHETIEVETELGTMTVYHPERYRDTYGYCPGDDVVSRTLVEEGRWERWETEAVRPLLRGGTFIDFGSQVGWYSVLAAQAGCHVIAIEADPGNAELTRENLRRVGNGAVWVRNEWVADPWFPVVGVPPGPIDLIKSDLEGNDVHAIRACWPLIERGQVNALLVEVSPVFADGYPALAADLMDLGYSATVTQREPLKLRRADVEAWVADCNQANILFVKER